MNKSEETTRADATRADATRADATRADATRADASHASIDKAGNTNHMQAPELSLKISNEQIDVHNPTRYGDWEKNGRCIDF